MRVDANMTEALWQVVFMRQPSQQVATRRKVAYGYLRNAAYRLREHIRSIFGDNRATEVKSSEVVTDCTISEGRAEIFSLLRLLTAKRDDITLPAVSAPLAHINPSGSHGSEHLEEVKYRGILIASHALRPVAQDLRGEASPHYRYEYNGI